MFFDLSTKIADQDFCIKDEDTFSQKYYQFLQLHLDFKSFIWLMSMMVLRLLNWFCFRKLAAYHYP